MNDKVVRHILCGVVNEYDELSHFRLIAPNMVNNISRSTRVVSSRVKVSIPKSDINHCKGDSYSTTWNRTKIKDSDYKVQILLDLKWVDIDIKLTDCQPHQFYKYIPEKYGYKFTKLGYVSSENHEKLISLISDLTDKFKSALSNYKNIDEDKFYTVRNEFLRGVIDKHGSLVGISMISTCQYIYNCYQTRYNPIIDGL